MKSNLEQGTHLKRDEFPVTLAGAYDLLVKDEGVLVRSRNQRGKGGKNSFGRRSRPMFAQKNAGQSGGSSADDNAALVPGVDGTINKRMTCWNCNRPGHGRDNCPDKQAGESTGCRGVANFMRGIQFAQKSILGQTHTTDASRFGEIPRSWILLDTCSTVDVTNNPDHVTNITFCDSNDRLEIVTNGGSMKYHHVADLCLLPLRVHYNELSMATILSLASVIELPGYFARMDSRMESAILVYTPSDKIYKFLQCKDGLYYFDTERADIHILTYSNTELSDYPHPSFVQTVASNKQFLTPEEIKGADNARKEQELLGWPSTAAYKTYINNNLINNTATTADDINRAVQIYGKPLPILEGKMTRPKASIVKANLKRAPLPISIKTKFQDIHLYVDFFFVNKMAFLLTKSGKLDFLTVEYMKTRTKGTITNAIKDAIAIYQSRGLRTAYIHGDGEFDMDKLRQSIDPIELITYGKNEHLAEIEREIRTCKERMRCTMRAFPYSRYTRLMTVHLVVSRVKLLNKFPRKGSACQTVGPAGLILGHEKPDMNVKRIPFGAYAIAYQQTSNDMKPRSIPAIALSEANNKGGHYFMSLATGKQILAYGWNELPIDEDVIARVEELAMNEEQPVLVNRVPLFEWAPREEITDVHEDDEQNEEENIEEDQNENDKASINENDESDDSDDDSDTDDDDNDEDGDGGGITAIPGARSKLTATNDDAAVEEETVEEIADETQEREQSNEDNEEIASDTSVINEETTEEEGNNERPRRSTAGIPEERYEPTTKNIKKYEYMRKRHFIQFKGKKKYVQLAQVKKMMGKVRNDQNAPGYLHRVVNVIFTQLEDDKKKYKDMPAAKGIKLFGERAVAAVLKEFTQLSEGPMEGKPVIEPIHPSNFTAHEIERAMEAVNLIKQKCCGKIKMRSCANGSNQWKFAAEDDNFSSPTVQLKSLFLSMMIDVYEGRDVAIFDIPGAYLHAEMPKDKTVLMKFRGQFADIMSKVNLEHAKNIVYENGKKVLYIKVLQAIYGCIESALLWYNLYASTLKGMGFEINPYDKCVANKIDNVKSKDGVGVVKARDTH
jgi:hypothetical protein